MPWTLGLLLTVAVICGLLFASAEAGFRWGRRQLVREGQDADKGLGVIEGAVFALLGLLIAFSFSSAGDRFETRRLLIAEEANAISTSYLRLDLLGSELSAPIRPLYRDYLEVRIAESKHSDDAPARAGSQAATEAQQARIWAAVNAALEQKGQPALAMAMLGPLNEMIDITTTRRMAAMLHPPGIVFAALALVAMLATFLAGHARGLSGRRSPLHTVVFVLVISGTIYSIIELEYPRLGFVTIQDADVVLAELRGMMR
ncbi:hypothetical protein [Silanimonas sp.]|jgi:hypothetical protein|uniref:bestrophin-like domain n=1 Tax=Silanimonas sp. TaxID=1929290 RepID=UPI0022C99419|nr:hypothetical protein [Silanimonas sp.]MCZ8064022.1 hypothetical protein [Silanimonas sp.]